MKISGEQLKELGHRLTGLNVIFDSGEGTILKWADTNKFININCLELRDIYYSDLQDRGYHKTYLFLQALLHEIAHYKQYLKYGKNSEDIFENWMLSNKRKAEDIADRYALMYYRRFLK